MNRQPRLLLSVLVLGVLAFVGWRWWSSTQQRAGNNETELVIGELNPRGGTLTCSLRSEPRSFNRLVMQSIPTDVFSTLTQGKLVRVNRATQELEPSLAEKVVRVG